MEIKVLAIDLAKDVFQICGVDGTGKTVLKKKLRREELSIFTAQLKPCRVAMEACGGSHYWSRRFAEQGHTPQILAARFVQPFRQSIHKNDQHDAQAIAEAAGRPRIRSVPIKSLQAQDLQSLHRVRDQFVKIRTATINQCRGLAMEYGVVMSKGRHNFEQQIPVVLEEASELTSVAREILTRLRDLVKEMTIKITEVEAQLAAISAASDDYKRLMDVPGVGPMTASLMLASVSDVEVFKNGRHLSAWVGLVPRQFSSGGKASLKGITKAGDPHLRAMLIHGARALIQSVRRKNGSDPLSQWILKLLSKKGWNVTAVAVANRNCRVMWHLMRYQQEYKKGA